VRVALVRLSVAGALVAVVLGARNSWPNLSEQRAHLTEAQAARAAAVHERLPVGLFDRMRAQVGRGDRWWLEIPIGRPEGLTTRDAIYRLYAVYWLLPALPADSAEDATHRFRIPSTP
jgi:hypothetical protein